MLIMKKPIPNDFMTDLLAYKYNSHLNPSRLAAKRCMIEHGLLKINLKNIEVHKRSNTTVPACQAVFACLGTHTQSFLCFGFV